MSVDELLSIARAEKPHVQYTKNRQGSAIAAWHDGRWIAVASHTITGQWVRVAFEVLVNGVPAWPQSEWIQQGV